jgi:hypothetical protein
MTRDPRQRAGARTTKRAGSTAPGKNKSIHFRSPERFAPAARIPGPDQAAPSIEPLCHTETPVEWSKGSGFNRFIWRSRRGRRERGGGEIAPRRNRICEPPAPSAESAKPVWAAGRCAAPRCLGSISCDSVIVAILRLHASDFSHDDSTGKSRRNALRKQQCRHQNVLQCATQAAQAGCPAAPAADT